MKVSLQTANYYSNVDLLSIPQDELLKKIGEQLGAVEDVTNWAERYKGIYVVKVVEVNDHPDADKLHVCIIDDGGVVENVERTPNGLVQIVCGAPEVAVGMTLAWITPGAVVPATFDKDPFVLEVRAIRGVPSPGMLGTPNELGISDDQSQLLQIDVQEVGKELARPGTPFVKLYGLDDIVVDCENKMFTHRPDCFGILGVARELAGISGQAFKSPDWYRTTLPIETGQSKLPLTVFNYVPELTPRFMAVAVDNVTIKPSPYWLQAALTRVGIRPINNIVDITNFMMQLTGQPMHAFDYHKIEKFSKDGATLGVRMAKEGEEIAVLNGKVLKLTEKDIVLSTDTTAADLAGIIGGAHTEIDADTKAIILTCATFDMYAVRRATMRHGVFTDAATRYTKGQSMLQNDKVLSYAIKNIKEMSGGSVASEVFDDPGDLHAQKTVSVTANFINTRLDTKLSAEEISKLLTNVEFEVSGDESNIVIVAPFWRTDIEIPEDIVEEVGRLYGYDKLPVVLPRRSSTPVSKNPALELNNKLRNTLSKAGANEVLTYSFVSGQLINTAEQNADEAYQLSNALSPELQYYRLTLTPSLLSKVHTNIRAGFDKFAIFEIGRTHLKLQGVNEEGLPQENPMLSLVYAANDKKVAKDSGAAFYSAKRYLNYIADTLGLVLDYEALSEDITYEITKPFQPGRAALVTDRKSGNYIGVIGEFRSSVRRKLKFPQHTAGFEIMLQPLLETQASLNYQALGRFPATTQDVTFVQPKSHDYSSLSIALARATDSASTSTGNRVTISPLGIYHKDKSKDSHISFRLNIENLDRTMTTDEATKFVDEVVKGVQAETGAKRA